MKAKKQHFECQKRIVAHEYQVGRLYFVMGEYFAAKDRLELIDHKYPQAVRDLGYEEQVAKMVAASGNRVNEGDGRNQVLDSYGLLGKSQ